MSYDDEELGLAPRDDDDLGLVPVEEIKRPIAPDVSIKSGVRLIPVTCTTCRTRMYAGENQVGLWKKCPDCERLTEIRPAPPSFPLVADDPEAAGGYEIGEPEEIRREPVRLGFDYRTLDDRHGEESLPPPALIDRPPLMERVLERFMKNDEEKSEEARIVRREAEIAREVETIKQAVREGKLERHLAERELKDAAADPAARKNAAKQREFAAAVSPPPIPPRLPGLMPDAVRASTPPKAADPNAVFAALDDAVAEVAARRNAPDKPPRRTAQPPAETAPPWLPLLDRRCRARMIVLVVCGLLGNFFGEKARSMIWQVLIDRVYGQSPGYSYNTAETGLLVVSFWVGAVLTVVWIVLLFLFGISLFQAASRGNDRVDRWIPFSLDFGFSYAGYTILTMLVAGIPGLLLREAITALRPAWAGPSVAVYFLGLFLCFPILFLCLVESDSFFGAYPRKTLSSLVRDRGRWLRFYVESLPAFGVPVALAVVLYLLGANFADLWIMQSLFYYLAASVLLTFCGFFVLPYFRLLGRLAFAVRENMNH